RAPSPWSCSSGAGTPAFRAFIIAAASTSMFFSRASTRSAELRRRMRWRSSALVLIVMSQASRLAPPDSCVRLVTSTEVPHSWCRRSASTPASPSVIATPFTCGALIVKLALSRRCSGGLAAEQDGGDAHRDHADAEAPGQRRAKRQRAGVTKEQAADGLGDRGGGLVAGEPPQPGRHGPDWHERAARVAEEHQEEHGRVGRLRRPDQQAERGGEPGGGGHEQQQQAERGGEGDYGRVR